MESWDVNTSPQVESATTTLGFDRKSLDALYDQRIFAPNAERVLARMERNSQITRDQLGSPLRVAYGPDVDENVDIYRPTSGDAAPIFVFIHGGSWLRGSAARAAFPAEMFVRSGIIYAALDFMSIDRAKGQLAVMVEQLQRGLMWIHENASTIGGDANRIYLGGHSSGAHLASVLLSLDWIKEGAPSDLLKAGICISGIYDLYPISLTSRKSFIDFNDRAIEEMSAIRHVDRIGCPMIIAFGSHDSPEFQRQGRAFAQAIAASGRRVEVIYGEEYNHFEIAETLANPYGLLGKAALSQLMRLS